VDAVLDLAGRLPENLRLAGSYAEAADAISKAGELVVFFGSEGLDLRGSRALAEACGAYLAATGHAGKSNSGLVAVWSRANDQGAADLGLRPLPDIAEGLGKASAAYLAACDPLGDDPSLEPAIQGLSFLVVQELYRTATAERADVVFPAQSFVEREGSLTSGEGRVQRFYPAVPPLGETRTDWWIAASLGARLGAPECPASAAEVLGLIAAGYPAYAGLSFAALAEVHEQWPRVGGDDLYFGGTAYDNRQGLGAKRATGVELGATLELAWPEPAAASRGDGLLIVPIHRLYDRGTTLQPSRLLEPRRAAQNVQLNPSDAERAGIRDGAPVTIEWDGRAETVEAALAQEVPQGVALVPRSSSLSLPSPARGRLRPAGERTAP
jgi:NADH-quinone oxidoreductase subunit G